MRRAGIDYNNAFTTVLMPSFLETTLNGLNALKDLKPLTKDMSDPSIAASRIHVRIENITMIKSRMFHGSLI